MHRIDRHRPSLLRSLTVALLSVQVTLLPLLAPVARALAPASFDELIAQAEQEREAGAYANSAPLYAQAYRARAEAERADPLGEVAVRSAMADYELATATNPDLALLEAQAELLAEFLTARRQVQAAAKAKKAKSVPDVPQDLVDELARLQGRIDALRKEVEIHEPAAAAGAEPEPEPEPEPAATPESGTETPPLPSPGEPKVSAAILGIGVVSFVGGTTLIIGGVVNFGRTNDGFDTQIDALAAESAYTEEQRQTYRAGLDDWKQEGRNLSTALVVSGAVLAAAGIGLSTWGIVRIRKHRSAQAAQVALTPALGREHVGARLTVEF